MLMPFAEFGTPYRVLGRSSCKRIAFSVWAAQWISDPSSSMQTIGRRLSLTLSEAISA